MGMQELSSQIDQQFRRDEKDYIFNTFASQ
jgi:hypothetical protein